MTGSAGAAAQLAPAVPAVSGESLVRVPLFSDLAGPDRDAIARLFTQRVFAPGETVTKEGSDAAAFYLIESGTATVTVHGAFRRTLHPGDHFGEIALIDGRARSATVTADGELVCQGITLWDFQPLVQRNPTMAWTLLQTLAGMRCRRPLRDQPRVQVRCAVEGRVHRLRHGQVGSRRQVGSRLPARPRSSGEPSSTESCLT